MTDEGLTVIAVAIDDDPEVVRPFTDGLTMPVLYDREHLLTELYAISNVPTVVWIDEDGRIARPNGEAFGTDTFAEFTQVESSVHLDAVRRWVRTGEVDVQVDDAEEAVGDLSDDELRARQLFRIGAHLHRAGDQAGAERTLAAAVDLAPLDFTIRRAAMPLRGMDPFGAPLFELLAEWDEAGRPYHGLPADRPGDQA